MILCLQPKIQLVCLRDIGEPTQCSQLLTKDYYDFESIIFRDISVKFLTWTILFYLSQIVA